MSAQFLIPMATSLGFGVLFGSGISLVLVPSLYLMGEDLRLLVRGKELEPVEQVPVEDLVAASADRFGSGATAGSASGDGAHGGGAS